MNLKSRLRGYMCLGIFALAMTLVFGLGQLSMTKINKSQIGMEQKAKIQSTIRFTPIMEIEKTPDIPLLLSY